MCVCVSVTIHLVMQLQLQWVRSMSSCTPLASWLPHLRKDSQAQWFYLYDNGFLGWLLYIFVMFPRIWRRLRKRLPALMFLRIGELLLHEGKLLAERKKSAQEMTGIGIAPNRKERETIHLQRGGTPLFLPQGQDIKAMVENCRQTQPDVFRGIVQGS